MAGVLYLFNYDDLAGVDLGLQPTIDLRNLGIAHDLLSGEHVHHAAIDGADSDFLGLSGLALFWSLNNGLYLDAVFGHCCSPFVWGFARDINRE